MGIRMKRMLSAVAMAATTLVTAAVITAGPLATTSAQAADLSQFDPGNIVSDEVFFDSATMNETDVYNFFRARIGNCSSGRTCLLNYYENTSSRAADSLCGAYGGAASEPSWRIVTKVAQSCGINPRTLIVMLQKEQGLVTNPAPSASAFRIAMGYGCPDTAPCDSLYYGFYNQVYNAAHQLKRYGNGNFRYNPGWNTIQWHPNAGCGSSQVYIYNKATAALYNYTPYRPNAAALSAGYGIGDGCSTYGNRNFFNYFVDWFGATTYDVPGGLGEWWRAHGSSASEVGTPAGRAGQYNVNGVGWAQKFTKGWLYYTTFFGGAGLRTDSGIFARYAADSSQYGTWGWPRGSETCVTAGCATDFQGGLIGWTATSGIQVVQGQFADAYRAAGGVTGRLGAPTGAPVKVGDGSTQSFSGGTLYQRSGRTVALPASSAITRKYVALGTTSSSLGWPVSGETCDARGCWTQFEKGLIAWRTADQSVSVVSGEAYTVAQKPGFSASGLGLPLADSAKVGSGTVQRFEGGSVYVSAAASTWLLNRSALTQSYTARGGPTGALGWPTGPETCGTSTCAETFEKGVLTWSGATGVKSVTGAIATAYAADGGYSGLFGVAATEVGSYPQAGGGSAQDFVGGYYYLRGDTAFGLRKASGIFQRYSASGSQSGPLGWPASVETCTSSTCWISFQKGSIGWSSGTGTRMITERVQAVYDGAGGATGVLGMPSSELGAYGANGGGSAQDFVGGYVYLTSTTGVYLRKNSAIFQRYSALGSQNSALGWPTSSETCTSSSCTVTFQKGEITWTSAGGVVVKTR